MEKTHKKILGLLGLALVVAMTVFAIILPDPSASAIENVTDNITITVLDEVPSVDITYPPSDGDFTSLNDKFTIKYTNTSNYTVTVTYIDEDGNEHTKVIESVDTSAEGSGTGQVDFRSAGAEFGYGHYVVTVTATGLDGSEIQDSVDFDYVAVTAEASTSGGGSDGGGSDGGGSSEGGDGSNDGVVTVDLNYDTSDPTIPEENKVDHFVITVYDENGNEVPGISPITVTAPTKQIEIPFGEYDLPSGKYTLVIVPYNNQGDSLYRTVVLEFYYNAPEIVVPDTANTGGLFNNLNISRSDYLITGIGVFAVISIGGIVFISRRSRK